MRCAWTCCLIKTSFPHLQSGFKLRSLGRRRRAPPPLHSNTVPTPARWFYWAPAVSRSPSRLIQSFPARTPLSPRTRTHAPDDPRDEKSFGCAAKMQISPASAWKIGVTIPQIISLLYFENVNLHSGFPCGVGWLIRSISVRLVPRQPRKRGEKEGAEEGGREGGVVVVGGRSDW